MNYTGIVQIFEHQHKCEREGEQITIPSACESGIYFSRRPVCVEIGAELNLVHTDKFLVPEKGDD